MIRTYEKPTALALSVSYDNLLPVDTVANLKEGFGMLGTATLKFAAVASQGRTQRPLSLRQRQEV